jgi:hypothetical protein
VSDQFVSPRGASGDAPLDVTWLPHQSIRSPHVIPRQPVSVLVQRWSEARSRILLAKRLQHGELREEDLFAELAYGARIAQEATSGRWCAVADLLRAGAVESWAQVGIAMDLTETEARDGFHGWIAGQVSLRRQTGTISLTGAEAEELFALSEAVAW